MWPAPFVGECKEEIAEQVEADWNTQPAFYNSVNTSMAQDWHKWLMKTIKKLTEFNRCDI